MFGPTPTELAMQKARPTISETDVRRLSEWVGTGLGLFGMAVLALFGVASILPGTEVLSRALPVAALALAAIIAIVVHSLGRISKALGELLRREAQARYEATHDAVSGLPNRRYFIERLEGCLASAKLAEHTAVAAYIDIDGFKEINDAFGHDFGDRLITALAQRLDARLRPEDFLARLGGDEFAVLCAPAGVDGPAALSRSVARAFAMPFAVGGRTIRVSASVGIASAPDHAATTVDLMRCADLALYEAKRNGRDRAVIYSPRIERKRREERAIETDLRAALRSGQLRLAYQPIVSPHTNTIVGVEALLRWRCARRGEVSPSTFIPIAEGAGLMPELGDWVLHRAMADAKRWPALVVCVNLSPVQLRHVNLASLLRRLLSEHGVAAERFVLEVAEGAWLDANGRTKRMLEAVRALGFKLALNFGVGHSSLAYLQDFKFDRIKLDRSLANGGESARAVAQAAAALGRALKMEIVAEGVETESEAMLMQHLGCTQLQGFYFSRPVEADDVNALFEKYQPKRISYERPRLQQQTN